MGSYHTPPIQQGVYSRPGSQCSSASSYHSARNSVHQESDVYRSASYNDSYSRRSETALELPDIRDNRLKTRPSYYKYERHDDQRSKSASDELYQNYRRSDSPLIYQTNIVQRRFSMDNSNDSIQREVHTVREEKKERKREVKANKKRVEHTAEAKKETIKDKEIKKEDKVVNKSQEKVSQKRSQKEDKSVKKSHQSERRVSESLSTEEYSDTESESGRTTNHTVTTVTGTSRIPGAVDSRQSIKKESKRSASVKETAKLVEA